MRARVGYQRRTVDDSSSPVFSLDLVPTSHFTLDTSIRLNSLLGAFLPTAGLEMMRDRPLTLRIQFLRPSIGILLTEWAVMEMGVAMLFRHELQESEQPEIGDFGVDGSLRFVILL